MIVDRIRWRRVEDQRVDELQEGRLLRTKAGSRALCFVRLAGRLHALADQCPHQGKPLSGGWCEDGWVVCPWHRFHFDPATGKARNGVCANAEVFPLERRKDGWYVGFPYTTLRFLGIDWW